MLPGEKKRAEAPFLLSPIRLDTPFSPARTLRSAATTYSSIIYPNCTGTLY